jgi:hypothetical protein
MNNPEPEFKVQFDQLNAEVDALGVGGGGGGGLAEWDSGTAYTAGQIVLDRGGIWKAVDASTNSQPISGNAHWTLVGGMPYVTTRLTPAILFALDDERVELVPAPGAGKINIPTDFVFVGVVIGAPFDFNTVTFKAKYDSGAVDAVAAAADANDNIFSSGATTGDLLNGAPATENLFFRLGGALTMSRPDGDYNLSAARDKAIVLTASAKADGEGADPEPDGYIDVTTYYVTHTCAA